MEDLEELINEAHERDMKVIIELVTNYVSDSHPIVSDSVKEDWLYEDDDKPVEQYPWLEEVVTLNQDNPEVDKYLKEVDDYWIDETEINGYILQASNKASDYYYKMFAYHIHVIKYNVVYLNS